MTRALRLAAAALCIGAAAVARPAPLPVFTSSDAAHDRLLNDLFLRHLRIDESDTSLRRGAHGLAPTIGTCQLWRDWEIDQLIWFDNGPATFAGEDRRASAETMLNTIPVDSFGYVFSAHDSSPPADLPAMVYFGMGWPFPDYPQAFGGLAGGWEFNGSTTDGWTTNDIGASEVRAGAWTMRAAGPDPRILSPELSCDWLHVPFLFLDLQIDGMDPGIAASERRFRVYWTTTDQPTFAEERSVSSDSWPVIPLDDLKAGLSRRIWLPMYLHPGWRGHRITRLRIHWLTPAPGAPINRATGVTLKALRLSYDTRHSVNNPILIRAAARKFFWDGKADQLRGLLPKMRSAALFLLEHMRVRRGGVPDQSFFVGHDGLGYINRKEWRVGHGIGSNYFDILPMGPIETQSAVMTVQALEAMSRIEAWVAKHPEADSPRPTVRGPDGVSRITYRETAASLAAMAVRSRQALTTRLWNPAAGRFAGWRDVNGALRDYGFAHFNLEALAAGVVSSAQAASILAWLDGRRVIAGDTSQGADIYRFAFAARMSTRRNELDYVWPWRGYDTKFGDQVQDGGAVLFTTFFDVKGRLRYGDVDGAWCVWRRMLDHHAAVIAAGGKGPEFYRAYYRAHPGEGAQQGGGTAGGLGLDEEFVESLLTPTAWATAWLGLDAPEPDVLEIAPRIPRALTHIGVRGALWRGARLDITARAGEIDLRGSALQTTMPGRIRLVFHGAPARARVLRSGRPDAGAAVRRGGALVWTTRPGADRFTLSR